MREGLTLGLLVLFTTVPAHLTLILKKNIYSGSSAERRDNMCCGVAALTKHRMNQMTGFPQFPLE